MTIQNITDALNDLAECDSIYAVSIDKNIGKTRVGVIVNAVWRDEFRELAGDDEVVETYDHDYHYTVAKFVHDGIEFSSAILGDTNPLKGCDTDS